jgi:hypothetical protein
VVSKRFTHGDLKSPCHFVSIIKDGFVIFSASSAPDEFWSGQANVFVQKPVVCARLVQLREVFQPGLKAAADDVFGDIMPPRRTREATRSIANSGAGKRRKTSWNRKPVSFRRMTFEANERLESVVSIAKLRRFSTSDSIRAQQFPPDSISLFRVLRQSLRDIIRIKKRHRLGKAQAGQSRLTAPFGPAL